MKTTPLTPPLVDASELQQKVMLMYRDVALEPKREYHFEMGRILAEKLGYTQEELDPVPAESIDSFAGVGYFFDLANLKQGDIILDLGSGSGMDTFIAARKVGDTGLVIGVDLTAEQLDKANRLAIVHGINNVTFRRGDICKLSFPDEMFDAVISNGVINLCTDKDQVFSEVARVLKPKGKMAVADIVSQQQLPDNIVCDATLWASCIGGASQEDTYYSCIQKPGMEIRAVRNNTAYEFLSKSARGASKQYGVRSVSLLAEKK